MSFAEALQSKADKTQQSHPRQAAAAVEATVAVAQPRVQTSPQWQEAAGQSVAAPTVNSHCQGSNCTTVAATVTMAQPRVQTSPKWQEAAGQSVAAPTVHSLPVDNTVRS
jgi:hypothetical protein